MLEKIKLATETAHLIKATKGLAVITSKDVMQLFNSGLKFTNAFVPMNSNSSGAPIASAFAVI